MKKKLSLLIATLIFGCSSFSYASEKNDKFESDFDLNEIYDSLDFNNDNDIYNAPDSDDDKNGDEYNVFEYKNSIWSKKPEDTKAETYISDLNNSDSQFLSQNNNTINNYTEDEDNYSKNTKERLMNHLKIFSNDTTIIPTIDAFNIANLSHNDFSRFNPNVKIIDFRDCLGRKYKNINMSTLNSRVGGILYSSELKYSEIEKEQVKELLKTITKIYIRYFPHKKNSLSDSYKLNFEESQIEKTKLIHFIEDVIIKCVWPHNLLPFIYNKLFGTLNFLCNYDDKKYFNKIMQAWDDYLNPNKPFKGLNLLEAKDFKKIRKHLKSVYQKFNIKRNKYFKKIKHLP